MLIEKASSDIGEFYSQGQRGARWGWGMHAVKSFLHFSLVVRIPICMIYIVTDATVHEKSAFTFSFIEYPVNYTCFCNGYMTVKVICFNLNNYP